MKKREALRGMAGNAVAINYWRVMCALWWLGFLEVGEGESWHTGAWLWRQGDGYDAQVAEMDERKAWALKAPQHTPEGFDVPIWHECGNCGGLGITPPSSEAGL